MKRTRIIALVSLLALTALSIPPLYAETREADEKITCIEERERQLTACEEEVTKRLSELNTARTKLLSSNHNPEDLKAELAALDEQISNL